MILGLYQHIIILGLYQLSTYNITLNNAYFIPFEVLEVFNVGII
jgi:hypothetical protein